MLRRVFFTLIAVAATASIAAAAPIFYLTTDPNGGAVSNLDIPNLAPGSTGTLYLAANSDIQLSSVSLDVLSSNPNVLKLTGASVINGGRYSILDGPMTVAADGSSISSLGGIVFVGTGPTGIGTGSGVPNPAVVASLNYTAGSNPGTSAMSLRVGQNVIGDWNGVAPSVQFGASQTAIDGGAAGTVGAAGSVTIQGVPEPATLTLIGLAMFGGLGASRRRH